MSAHEYEYEDIPGVPGTLPASEKLLWQGRPTWRSFLIHVLHVRWVLGYFAALALWRYGSAIETGKSVDDAVVSASWVFVLAAISTVLLMGLAWAYTRTTIYTITSKRIVLRFGVAVPMAVNIPHTKIESVGLKTFADQTGEIPVRVGGDDKLAYLVLWPHAKRWQFNNPQPMFRSVPDAGSIATILARAVSEAQAQEAAATMAAEKAGQPRAKVPTRRLKPLVAAAA
jgi:hypothetical protein